MNEKERRLEAIRRVAQGESISAVCAALNRSRPWYYQWAARFRVAGTVGLEDQRLGATPTNKTPTWIAQLCLETRDRLVQQAEDGASFAGIGTREVARQLDWLGHETPHWTTINRILRASGYVGPEVQPVGYCPRPQATAVNEVHQIDIWPRVLQGGQKVYFFHLVDVACWYPHGIVMGDKSTDTALAFLVDSWQTVGLPQIAQFDNEMTFTGGRWAHRLGRVVRLCLALGIAVWFIPFYTPKRNGFVEAFHSECLHRFWSRTRFEHLCQVQASYPLFLHYFRHQRRLPAIEAQTPQERRAALFDDTKEHYLPSDFNLHQRPRLPIVAGTIHCLRLADNHGQVNMLNHRIDLGVTFARHYILAQIRTAQQQMTLYHQPDAQADLEVIGTYPFPLSNPVCDFAADFQYPTSAE
jgi:transposase